MNIHEFQAKEILKRFGVAVPQGIIATTAEEAKAAAQQLGGGVVVVKAQIHAGGRGKGGGVKVVKSPEEAADKARQMRGRNLVTRQTGPEGRQVRRVLVEQGLEIQRELYLAMVMDRAQSRVTVICSSEGGVEIEEVAAKAPEKILKETVDPAIGLAAFQCRRLAFAMNFDSNAFFRQKEIVALRDLDEEDPREVEASKYDLSYISLDGNIACMVNGAGLAMATMDIIKHHGGEPANFLDVGGGADKEKVAHAFRILLAASRVRGVLINMFGGIMRCDVLAQGVVDAARELKIAGPLVVRMQGTNVEQGRQILAASGLTIISADTMAEAAEKIVRAVKQF